MFQDFAASVHDRLQSFDSSGDPVLFKAVVPDLFDEYLAAFPVGTNPLFRERTTHDCQCCKHFLRNLGSLVRITEAGVETLWSIDGLPAPYDTVAARLDALIKGAADFVPYFTKEPRFGTRSNFDNQDPSIEWHHFYGDTPRVCKASDPGSRIADLKSAKQILSRGLNEIRPDDIDQVLDLISSNALYRGEEFKKSVQNFKALRQRYAAAQDKSLFVLRNLLAPAARFRNTVIGTLLTDLADGDGLEVAVKKFETKVAPLNYKRPTALITPRMIEQAVGTLRDLGLEEAIERRIAAPEDLNVSDVLFVDASVSKRLQGGVEALLLDAVKPKKTRAKEGTEISIEDFVALGHKRIELVLDRNHLSNFAAITAPVNRAVKRLFKWNNNFAWSYDGDATDSIKQRVKKAGGNIDALLRCSLAWSNYDDLDIHCVDPSGLHISYMHKCGVLDVDMNAGGRRSREPVENLSWNRLQDGIYRIAVNQFSQRELIDVGFTLQVEFDGTIREYSFDQAVHGEVKALNLHVSGGRLEKVEILDSRIKDGTAPIEKWGVKTGIPVKVTTAFLSPNHWHGAGAVGNRHWFFALDGCATPEPVRGIYNEFLLPALEPHRKVFEVLGAKTKCQPTENQLAGVGFSATRRDTVTAVADGRPYKIIF